MRDKKGSRGQPAIVNVPLQQQQFAVIFLDKNAVTNTNISAAVNMDLLKELITKSINQTKENDADYKRSRSFTRQKFDNILSNLQTNLVSQIETNQSRLLTNANINAADNNNNMIVPSSSSSSNNKEIIIIDSPEKKLVNN